MPLGQAFDEDWPRAPICSFTSLEWTRTKL